MNNTMKTMNSQNVIGGELTQTLTTPNVPSPSVPAPGTTPPDWNGMKNPNIASGTESAIAFPSMAAVLTLDESKDRILSYSTSQFNHPHGMNSLSPVQGAFHMEHQSLVGQQQQLMQSVLYFQGVADNKNHEIAHLRKQLEQLQADDMDEEAFQLRKKLFALEQQVVDITKFSG